MAGEGSVIEAPATAPVGGAAHALAAVAGAPEAGIVVVHAPAEAGYCQGCSDEYHELLRDKRGELDIDCPLWLQAPAEEKLQAFVASLGPEAPQVVLSLVEQLSKQAGALQPSCQCPHLLAAGTPHQRQTGPAWCVACQVAHDEPHPFVDLSTFTFRRAGGHEPACGTCGTALRCLCATPEAAHVCPTCSAAQGAETAA